MKSLFTLLSLIPFILLAQETQKIESSLEVVRIKSGKREVIYKENRHFEAPNWSNDGKFFIINSKGILYKLDRKKKVLEEIPTGFARACNNDHGISPDGKKLVISHHNENPDENKGSTIYTLPINGGTPVKITEKTPAYWHGWSPDGKTLAFVGERNGDYDIYTIPVNGGEETRLTTSKGLDDGPDYSPDGKNIYFNSYQSGHMHIWRMDADGNNQVQLTNDSYSNWFPHPSPNGKYIVYISYLQDQEQGHPFGKDVKLRIMDLKTQKIRDLTDVFFGGQGTINVSSWSPDSKEVAFVSYKILE
ncbi:MAG: TolB family protein [Bacteroidales bacterium]|nr:TolB family protein [Bacteroidales bacterium]